MMSAEELRKKRYKKKLWRKEKLARRLATFGSIRKPKHLQFGKKSIKKLTKHFEEIVMETPKTNFWQHLWAWIKSLWKEK